MDPNNPFAQMFAANTTSLDGTPIANASPWAPAAPAAGAAVGSDA